MADIGGDPFPADPTDITPSSFSVGDVINCSYSGSKKSITLPPGRYKLQVWGAEGGYRSSTNTYSGKGGYSIGTVTLKNGATLYLYAGGAGNTGKTSGGFNGGGARDTYNGGGGGSDIRISQDSLYARVIVAGGGGSDGDNTKYGLYGGGTTGGSASQNFGSGGGGGTQTAGGIGGSNNSGSFGQGGRGRAASSGYAGAGGGGWYGGGGSYPDSSGDDDRGGGGGSGYVYKSDTASSYPSGCLLNSEYYLADAATYAGNTSFVSPSGSNETGHTGDGHCRITVVELYSSFYMKTKINGVWKDSNKGYVKINGLWKEIEKVFTKIEGTWNSSAPPADLISFSIAFPPDTSGTGTNTTVYQAEKGMTWDQWVKSPYNTDGWFTQDLMSNGNLYIVNGTGPCFVTNPGNDGPAWSTDTIISDSLYVINVFV